jgi:DNA-binding response OmpR family regulator
MIAGETQPKVVLLNAPMNLSRQILLLEDEPLLREMLALTLIRNGYKVLTAGSLEDAETVLSIMGWTWADLVISDANLNRHPDVLHGYLFHARWEARFPVPPFIFLQGHNRIPAMPWAESCRTCHVIKPFEPSWLLLLIRSLIGG